jgi:predicted peroxiredoxin
MPTHAQIINAQYTSKGSNFVTLASRLQAALTIAPQFQGQLIGVIAEFKRRHPDWSAFKDLQLCLARSTALDKVLIDATMQRALNIRHILHILLNFKETMVMAIQVYEDPDKPGYYIAWDGQHTAIALYIIVSMIYGEQAANAVVPIVIYPVKHKLEIRRNFILLNGEAKEPLDFIDKFKQMVCGVKIDGATDQEWVDAALKNGYFELADLFATHSKFGDEDQDGAFTLLADTIMSKSLKTRKHPEVTRMFARYWTFLNQQRPVDAKEARQLYEYFDACYEQGITVDDDYLLELVAFTKGYFGSDFSDVGAFWAKVRDAYSNWYLNANKDSTDVDANGNVIVRGFVKEWRCGGPFLISQIKKSTNLETPVFTANNGFTVAKKDLW